VKAAEFPTKPVDKFVDEGADAGLFGFQQLLSVKSVKI
jgi:hypothetical protein